MPKRFQRRRVKGYRLPAGVVFVGRGTKWGNPYVVHRHTAKCDANEHLFCPDRPVDNRDDAVRMFRHAVLYPIQGQPRVPIVDEIRRELAGKDLACWCPLEDAGGNPVPCHADVLLRIANEEVES